MATVLDIVGIASGGTRLALALFDLAEGMIQAGPEINAVASEISVFSLVLKQLDRLLSQDRAMYSEDLTKTINVVLRESRGIFDDIDMVVGRAQRQEALTLSERMKWPFNKSRVKRFKLSLESMKSTLMLMLQTLTLSQKISDRYYLPHMRKELWILIPMRRGTTPTLDDTDEERSTLKSLIRVNRVSQVKLNRLEKEGREHYHLEDGNSKGNGGNASSDLQVSPWSVLGSAVREGRSNSEGSIRRDAIPPTNYSLTLHQTSLTVGALLNRWTTLPRQAIPDEDPPEATSHFTKQPPLPYQGRQRREKPKVKEEETVSNGFGEEYSTDSFSVTVHPEVIGDRKSLNPDSCLYSLRKAGGDIMWCIKRHLPNKTSQMELYIGPKKFFQYPVTDEPLLGDRESATFIDKLWADDGVLLGLHHKPIGATGERDPIDFDAFDAGLPGIRHMVPTGKAHLGVARFSGVRKALNFVRCHSCIA
jgi:hypothetical protein